MGTKVHCKSYLPGFYFMRDLNEDSSSGSWPLFYGDKTIPNCQYQNGFMPRTLVDVYPGHQDKDALKQKMLEHEAVFKNQVCELHRLYRIQRDMMEEVKRKEVHKHRASMEPASSSSLQGSQVPYEDARKWHMAGFPLFASSNGRTFSGVEVVNSPMSCTKGNTTQPGQFPFPNGSTSKDSEALDSRPLKVRKKLFDLQLPADGYVDTEDGDFQEYREIKLSSYAPSGDRKTGSESSMRLFLGGHTGTKTDASASASCLKGSSIGLADLNEPVQVEEGIAPSCVDFLGYTSEEVKTKGIDQAIISKAGYFGLNRETIHVHDGFLVNSSAERKVNERAQVSYIHEGGFTRGNLISSDKLPLLSHPVQGMLNIAHHPPGIYPNGCSQEDPWTEGLRHGLDSSDRNWDHSNNSHLGPIASQNPFLSSSCFARTWARSVSSLAKPASNFAQKVTTLETSLSPAAEMSRNLQPTAHSQVGERWHINATSRLNPGLGSQSTLNGFHHASASSKALQVHLPSTGFEYLNCSRGDNLASDRTNIQKGSCHANSTPTIDIDLNEVEILQDLNTMDRKSIPAGHLSALPWLKQKPVRVNEFVDTGRDLNQPFTPNVMLAGHDSEIARKKEITETKTVQRILGFPVFERDIPDNEPSPLASTPASVDCRPEGKNVSRGRKNGIIDINVACEPDEHIASEEPTVENEKQRKGVSIRDHIDLNSCVSDCEDPPTPCYERNSAKVKITLEIDLEVPALLESEDDSTLSKENIPDEVSLQPLENKNEQIQDDVLRNAAETIVAISSSSLQIHTDPSEASLAEALLWFVDSLSTYANEPKKTSVKEWRVRKQGSFQEIDDFEAMTLQLAETKEEDYMPKPFIPEFQNIEDTGANALPTRPRRGQARRGRQRRDFQRDILPGLTSLSRHEVTEDLQTFGGLMRATGHSWNLGLTRRNGGGRGRRRAVVETVQPSIPSPVCPPLMQQLNHIEAGLEDRSLTGWGKTTRRPRRQRCPAGNPPTVALA